MKSTCCRVGLALLVVLPSSLPAADVSDRFVPAQFKVWGTVVPSHAEDIVPEGCLESDPPTMDLGPEYSPQADDAQVGFRPYRHHCLGPMHPRFRPSPAALAMPEMKAFATWGQYTPMAVGIFAVKTVESLTAAVSDLTDDQGHKIPASCLDLRSVRYMPMPLGRTVYYLAPYILEKRSILSVPVGKSVFFWLTAYVQPQMPGGLYRGQVLLKAAGLPEQRVPIALRVLPFALDETSKWFTILHVFRPSTTPAAQGDAYHCRDEFVNFREHGMNHLAYSQHMPNFRKAADGKYQFDFDATPDFSPVQKRAQQGRPAIAEVIKMAVECGLDRAYFPHFHRPDKFSNGWICNLDWNTPEADQWYRDHFKAWWDESQKRKWPPIIFSISDEGNEKQDGTLKMAVHLARLAKEGCPDLPTSAFTVGWYFGEDDLGSFGNALDYVIDGPSSKQYLDKVKRLGKKHIAYNQAPPAQPLRCRYSYGFLMEAAGFLGHQQFKHEIPRKDGDFKEEYHWYPKGDLSAGDIAQFHYVFPTADGLLPSPALEAMREGVNDSRYIETLKNLLATADRGGSAGARKQASAMRDEFQSLSAAFTPFNSAGNNRGTQWLGETGPEAFDVARYRIARMIVRLRALMGIDKSAADPGAREWTDSTGQHHVSATLMDLHEGRVRLKKTDGTTISLPLDRLSAADQAFVREQLGARDEVKEVKKDEFVSLFDGKTLDGWKVGKNADSFTVRDGIIVVDGRPAFLFYDGPVADHNFKNFHFKADVMTYPNANSGIFFHTRYQEDGDAKFGAECQVNNSHRDWRRTGSLIGVMNVTEAPPGAGTNEAFQKLPAPPARDEVWFTQEIIVQGRQVVVKIDGNTILDHTLPPETQGECALGRMTWLPRGTFALQGFGPGSRVCYRKICVRLLPE